MSCEKKASQCIASLLAFGHAKCGASHTAWVAKKRRVNGVTCGTELPNRQTVSKTVYFFICNIKLQGVDSDKESAPVF